MQPWRSENRPTTFDEVSMERSKSFVKALQELKNLRPQLYSAAEYCERSYLHSEQKQMVFDNLKDYAVRALVNAVDHLGTVASKLTDLFEQQMFDVSIVETGISCLSQRSSTCQVYVNKEGRSQHQMSFRTLRHHKHYTLPSLADKTANSSMQMPPKSNVKAKPSSGTSGKSSSKTLSWHLATEVNSASGGASSASPCIRDPRTSKIKPELFHLLVPEEAAASLSSPSTNHLLAANGNATSDIASNKFGLVVTLLLTIISNSSKLENYEVKQLMTELKPTSYSGRVERNNPYSLPLFSSIGEELEGEGKLRLWPL